MPGLQLSLQIGMYAGFTNKIEFGIEVCDRADFEVPLGISPLFNVAIRVLIYSFDF